MRKWLMLTLLAVLLCGCSQAGYQLEEELPGIPLEKQKIWFVIDESVPLLARDAAMQFSKDVAELSGNTLSVEVRSRSYTTWELYMENASLLFIDSKQHESISPLLRIFADPFQYQDYRQFTMAANSAEALALLEEDLTESHGLKPLAAYYQGADFIVSVFPLSDYALFSNLAPLGYHNEDNPEQGIAATVLTRTRSSASLAFEVAGAATSFTPDINERIRGLYQETGQAAEFAPVELQDILWPQQDFYIARAYHNISPLWLVAQQDFYQALSDEHKAVLWEACAMLYDNLDNQVLAQEEEIYQWLLSQKMSDSESLVRTQTRIRSGLARRNNTVTSQERYLASLLDALR